MTPKEKKAALDGLRATRDSLEATMHEARGERARLQISNIDKYRDFLQKLGELSFLLGAAITPVAIVSQDNSKINSISFVVAGVALYLLGGLLAMWRSKQVLERAAEDAPFVGLEAEIHTYPAIHAHNKLLFELENKEYQKEYRAASLDIIQWGQQQKTDENTKVDVWLDCLLINFVIASLFVAKAIWPFSDLCYWLAFTSIAIFMAALLKTGINRSKENQKKLKAKRKHLADIKEKHLKWHNKNVLKSNDDE